MMASRLFGTKEEMEKILTKGKESKREN